MKNAIGGLAILELDKTSKERERERGDITKETQNESFEQY